MVTGIPVRAEFFDIAPQLPFGSPLRILVLGGSQGARQMNELLAGGLRPSCPKASAGWWSATRPAAATRRRSSRAMKTRICRRWRSTAAAWRPDGPRIQVETPAFIQHVAAAMAESHLVISRAGAITLAELCAAGRPSLLLAAARRRRRPPAAQRRAAGGGRRRPAGRRRASPESLAALIGDLLADRARLTAMADAARRLGHADAVGKIADRVEFWAARRRGER